MKKVVSEDPKPTADDKHRFKCVVKVFFPASNSEVLGIGDSKMEGEFLKNNPAFNDGKEAPRAKKRAVTNARRDAFRQVTIVIFPNGKVGHFVVPVYSDTTLEPTK